MKFSSKIQRCQLSPFFVFDSYAEQAKAKGIHIYHLNLGQPDILTPKEYYKALQEYSNPVISYPPSEGKPEVVDAVRKYYAQLGVDLKREDILITFGGSEALQMAIASIVDDGDEIIVPEPHYPNYRECTLLAGGNLHTIPTTPETGYRAGTPGQSWRTASSSWLLKSTVEYVFGLHPEISGLRIAPCLPLSWRECKITKVFRECTYNITFVGDGTGSDVTGITVNGNPTSFENNVVPAAKGATLDITVTLSGKK